MTKRKTLPKAISVNMDYYDKIPEVKVIPEMKADMIIDKKTGSIIKEHNEIYTDSGFGNAPDKIWDTTGTRFDSRVMFPSLQENTAKKLRNLKTNILRNKTKNMLNQNSVITLPLVHQIFEGDHFPNGIAFKCDFSGCTGGDRILTVIELYEHGIQYHNQDAKRISYGLLNVLDKIDNLP